MPQAAKNYSITELELFGLVINIYAFRQLLTNVHFECYCDHSAITYILNSKKRIATRRIQKLIEQLLQFYFTIHYLPGSKMHIADLLSRLAGKDLDPPDKVIPISFNAMQSQQPIRCSQRLKAKSMQSTHPTPKLTLVPPSYNPQVLLKRLQPIEGATIPDQDVFPHSLSTSISSKRRDTHNTHTDHIVPKKTATTKPIPKHKVKRPQLIYQHTAYNSNKTTFPSPPSLIHKSDKKSPVPPILSTDKITLVNPQLNIPQTLPPIEVPPSQTESIETYRAPEDFLYNKPLPILKDSKEIDIFTRHIPTQKEIDEFLSVLRAKVTKDYKLPLLVQSIINAYPQSPAFKNIYQYITTNTLPPSRRLQRSIISNGLLFKME